MPSSSARCLSALPLRRARPLLGTYVEIIVRDAPVPGIARTFARAFAAIEQVHRLMSPRDPSSDVARMNAALIGRPVKIHPWTDEVLAAARHLSEISGGVFDVTCGPGHDAPGWRELNRRPGGRVCRLASVTVDLGGIAKGYAVDRAVAALQEAGVRAATVNAGGDLRSFGDEPHSITIRHPASPGCLIPVGWLTTGAFATSANYLDAPGAGRLRRPDGRRLWTGRSSVSVHAPTAMIADALTKVVAAVGPDRSAPILRRYGATALIVTRSGRITCIDERGEGNHATRAAA